MPHRYAVVNARIATMDPREPNAEAMLVEAGRILAIGQEKKVLRGADGAKLLDLQGRTVTPGIIDAHTHLVHQGLLKVRLDLRDTRSLEEALRAVRKRVARLRAGELLLAERWDESRWKERRYPTKDELDQISRTHPIILRRVDGHIAVANTLACDLVAPKLDGVDPQSGHLVEQASLNLNQIFPTDPRDSLQALDLAQQEALRLGVTTVHDFVVPSYLRAYQALHRRGRLRIRAHVTPYVEYLDELSELGIETGWGDDRLRLGGIKLFADGSLGGHTAALRTPYLDDPTTSGKLNWSDAQLTDRIGTAHRSGLQVSAHAIGDAAIDQVLASYRSLDRRRSKQRHRIEHYEIHHPEHDEQMRDLGVVASMQPNFVGEWSRKGGMYHDRLGTDRYRHNNEFRRLLKAGVPLAFGSDCMPFDPWFGLAAASNAPHTPQRLAPLEALALYTRGSAASLHRDDLGRLKKGAHADFLVLDRPPTKTTIGTTRVDATFVAGVPEHQRRGTRLRFR